MDRSLASSTGSLVHTPSRSSTMTTTTAPMYPDLSELASSGPKHSSGSHSAPRNVRFVEGHSPQIARLSNPYGTPYASAPPTRIQNNSFSNQLHSVTPPKARLYVSGSSTSTNPATASSSSSPATQQSQKQGAIGFHLSNLPLAHKVAAPLTAAPKLAPQKLTPEIVKSRHTPPLGRAEAAKRLRVNAVLLVIWWLSSRTHVYKFLAGHLIRVVPQLDTPLHLLELAFALVLFYNILDAMRHLNRLSSLPLPSPVTNLIGTADGPLSSSPRLKQSSSQFSMHSPVRSSPKTRPAPSPSTVGSAPSTPTFRSAARNSPQPPSPQTPSALRSTPAGSALRQSILPTGSPGTGSPLARSIGAGSVESLDKGSPLTAYRARHSPVASKLQLNSKEGIDKLFS